MGFQRVEKRPAEIFSVGFRYSAEQLPDGETIASAEAAATDLDDGTPAPAVLGGTSVENPEVGIQVVSTIIQAGTAGKEYKVVVTSTLTNAFVFEDVFKITVVDDPGLN